VSHHRLPAPPPLEANDELVTAVITAAWAVALVVLLVLRNQIPPAERWWIWTCVAGVAMGLFALWYVPRMKRARARSAARRAQAQAEAQAQDAET
jgi:type VI protein secretion system component VasK